MREKLRFPPGTPEEAEAVNHRLRKLGLGDMPLAVPARTGAEPDDDTELIESEA